MADRTYIYIDGESHYMRSLDAWRDIHGTNACLERVRHKGDPSDQMILVIPKARVFWTKKMHPGVDRMTYYTSAVTDKQGLHEIKTQLRDFELDNNVYEERSDQANRRQNVLRDTHLLEKAKTVDISLTIQVMDDCHHERFNECHIYTSDIDFLPLVKFVRASGKRVYVHGYRDMLSKQSEYLHDCDGFIDLEKWLREQCELAPPK